MSKKNVEIISLPLGNAPNNLNLFLRCRNAGIIKHDFEDISLELTLNLHAIKLVFKILK